MPDARWTALAVVLAACTPSGPIADGPGYRPQSIAPSSASAVGSVAPVAPPPSTGGPVYRFDYVLSSERPGGAPTNATYSLSIQEHEKGTQRVGQNVPLQAGAPAGSSGPAPVVARVDIGFKVTATFEVTGPTLSLHSAVEFSTIGDATVPAGPVGIDRVTTDSTTVVTPGQETQVAIMEEAHSHRKYKLVVTATKIR